MTQTHRGSYGHPGREFGYIIEGTATLQYETVLYTLNEGDSVSFAAFSPHILTNTSNNFEACDCNSAAEVCVNKLRTIAVLTHNAGLDSIILSRCVR